MSLKSYILELLASKVSHSDFNPRAVNRLLVLRYDRIGDMITTLPALAHLHAEFPEVKIEVVASEANAGLVEALDFVHRVHRVPSRKLSALLKLALQLRKNEYDAVFCGVFNKTTESLLLSRIAGGAACLSISPWRGEKYKPFFSVYSKPVHPPSHWNMMMRSLCEAFKISDGSIPGSVGESLLAADSATSIVQAPYVVVNISAGIPERQWRAEVVVKIVEQCLEQTTKTIVVTGMPEDVASAWKVNKILQTHERVVWDSGTRDLLQLARLYADSHYAFTPDTGMVHLCGLFNIPLFVAYATQHSADIWPTIVDRHAVYVANKPSNTIEFSEIELLVTRFLQVMEAHLE